MSEIRILIVEDDPLIAADIEQCLSTIDYSVSAVVHNYEDAIDALGKNPPDAALLDIDLGGEKDGIAIAEYIRLHVKIPFVFLTSFGDRQTIAAAKKVQPAGYIIKPFDERDLLANLDIALYNYSNSKNAEQPKLSLIHLNRHLRHPMSDREFEILEALYEGKTNQQMAEQFFLSVSTIKTHVYSLYTKLDVGSRTEAIAWIRTRQG